jgi:hypothetical protein
MFTDSAAQSVPLYQRLEDAVTLLRHRLEQHLDQESRLQRTYSECESRCAEHTGHLTRHLAMLEGHLSTWMHEWQPRLTVVRAGGEAE